MIKECKSRRKRLLKQLAHNEAIIIFAAKEPPVSIPFRQNSDFYYLTGLIEPDAIMVLSRDNSRDKFILFSHANNPRKKLWQGPYIGAKQACTKYGADRAFPLGKRDTILPKLLSGKNKIYTNLKVSDLSPRELTTWLKRSDIKRSNLKDSGPLLHNMRLQKSPSEISLIKQAVKITEKGHLAAMQKCHPKMFEFALEAELIYEFTKLGSNHLAFPPIVAGGVNGYILHYSRNDKKIAAKELVLIDAGAEYKHYCADITRTFPANGRFTKTQRALYEIVLAAQKEVIKKVRPGIKWSDLQATAEKEITLGLINIGILKGSLTSAIKKKSCKLFFPHKIGHWLGLDVHDVGEYDNPFAAGMIITVEPGIYISPKAKNVAKKWRGINIRIEDDVLVTPKGHTVLSGKIPKEISAIEKVMRK